MDRYEVMAGKMAPLTDGAHRKWGFAGKVETRSYERLVDALIDLSHISAHWKEAARSGRSSLRRTSIWHGWNTRQTVIRRSTATWIR